MTTTRTKRVALWYAVAPIIPVILVLVMFAALAWISDYVESHYGANAMVVLLFALMVAGAIIGMIVTAVQRYKSYLKGGE